MRGAACSGCHACISICPQNCIRMSADGEGFLYPEIDKARCAHCGLCGKICPSVSVSTNETATQPSAYAAYNLDEDILEKSSSGGIFTLIAEQVLDLQGVVFGACFDETFRIVHGFTESKDELGKFRGSKYAQSDIGSSYGQAKTFLDRGRLVLFTGTPCQIGGFKAFLGGDRDNLLTQDLICHGAPSPDVWRRYVAFREKCAQSSTRKISFRQKNFGWKRYSVSFSFENETEYLRVHREDLYMKLFLRDICLRPSCYRCSFKTLHRQSDITLADFWGIEAVLPEMYNEKGVSLIITNSRKGEDLFDRVKPKTRFMKTDIDQAIQYNPAAIRSAVPHPKREEFFANIRSKSLEELAVMYCKTRLRHRVKSWLKVRLKSLYDRIYGR